MAHNIVYSSAGLFAKTMKSLYLKANAQTMISGSHPADE